MSRKKRHRKHSVEQVRRTHARAYEPWLPEEDESLRKFAELPIPELARMMQRRPGAVRSRLTKLGIEPGRKTPRVADTDLKPDEPAAAQVRAEKVESPRVGPWTPEEDEKLRQFANAPVPVLAELLRRRPDAIEVRLYKLGLYARGEAPLSLTRAPRPRRRRWPSATIVVGSFAVGLFIGLVGGYFVGWSRSSLPVELLEPVAPTAGQPLRRIAAEHEGCLRVATWNVRGYPEREDADTAWFHAQLRGLQAEILCVQEVANEERLAILMQSDVPYSQWVFADSVSGQDNGILVVNELVVEALDVPDGFQHPPQAAFVAHRGFDAAIVTLHLTWEPVSRRDAETRLLGPFVTRLLQIDLDVMLVGDFNLEPEKARALAEQLGLVVLMGSNQETVGTLHSRSSYDYFLASPDLANEEAQGATVVVFDEADLEIARRVSDHMPLLAFFACDDRFRDRPLDDGLND